MNRKIGTFVAASSILWVTGCSPQAPPPSPHAVDQQIQQIQDNPHMPDAAKEKAIQMIRSATAARSGTATEPPH